MTFEEICEFYGSLNAAANAIGITRQCAYAWKNIMGYIPYDKQKRLEIHSKGKLKATNFSIENSHQEIHFPCFRYYSFEHGMCKVKSLLFKPFNKTRITYYKDQITVTYTSFNSEYLMQGTDIKDRNGVYLFEKDIIQYSEGEKLYLNNLNDIYSIRGLNKVNDTFIIIGNKFQEK